MEAIKRTKKSSHVLFVPWQFLGPQSAGFRRKDAAGRRRLGDRVWREMPLSRLLPPSTPFNNLNPFKFQHHPSQHFISSSSARQTDSPLTSASQFAREACRLSRVSTDDRCGSLVMRPALQNADWRLAIMPRMHHVDSPTVCLSSQPPAAHVSRSTPPLLQPPSLSQQTMLAEDRLHRCIVEPPTLRGLTTPLLTELRSSAAGCSPPRAISDRAKINTGVEFFHRLLPCRYVDDPSFV